MFLFFFFKFVSFSFLLSFRSTAKLSRKYRVLLYTLPTHMHSLPSYWHSPPEWDFFFFKAIDKPILTHHSHPESVIYIRVTLGCVLSVGLNKHIVTCVHHYSIIQESFAVLKIPCACSPLPFPNPGNHWFFYCVYSFTFSRKSYSCNRIVCRLFRLASLI